MKISFIFLSVFVCAYVVNSCAALAINKEPMYFNTETSETGIIFGSVTFPQEKARFLGYFPRIEAIDNTNKKSSTEIQIDPNSWNAKHAGQLNGGKTYLFAIERKPGKYKIERIRLGNYNGIIDFDIPFELKKSQILYVGEIFIDEYAGENDTLVKLNDKYIRDVAGLVIHQPTVEWRAAKKSELKIDNKDVKPSR